MNERENPMSKPPRKRLSDSSQNLYVQAEILTSMDAAADAMKATAERPAPEAAPAPARERKKREAIVSIHMPHELAQNLVFASIARRQDGLVKTRPSVSQFVVEILMRPEIQAEIKQWARQAVAPASSE